MKIIAFLGNPGRKYKKTRHNIGFITGEYCAKKWGIKIGKKEFSGITGKGTWNGKDLFLLFPSTYMNNSGKSVREALSFLKTGTENLIVVHDEIELPFGEVRFKKGGGHKGHNGLRSIIQETGSADFSRIRAGVGRPENEHVTVADHVLSKFTGEEMKEIEFLLPGVEELILENI